MSRFLHGIKFEEPTLICLAPTFVLVAQLLDAPNSFWCHDLPHLLLVRNNQVVFNTLLNCLFFFIFSFCLAHLFLYLESSIGKEEQNILTLYYFHLIATFDCYPLLTLASNAGSELFMSTNDNPKTKTMITYVDGGFPTGQYEYDRQDQLRSLTYQNYYSTENNFFSFGERF